MCIRDRLWARWQATHPGLLPIAEAMFDLPPFNRPFTTEWQRGSDVESTDALGYMYRTFCFFLPPIRLWEVVVMPLPWPIRERMRTARLVIKTEKMQIQPLEVRVFLNQPRATARSKTIDNPSFVGAFGFLGHADAAPGIERAMGCPECALLGHTREHAHHAQHTHDDLHKHSLEPEVKERFDVELDVTESLRNADRDSSETSLKLVAVDANGDQVDAEDVVLEEIELVID